MADDTNPTYAPYTTPDSLRDLHDVNIANPVAGTKNTIFKNNALEVGPTAAAITSPTAPSAAYVQAEAQSAKVAIDAILTAIRAHGIIT